MGGKIIGGRTRGKGRGVHDMVLVAGAVEVKQRKHGGSLNQRRTGRYAGRVRLSVVPDRSAKSLGGFIERVVTPGATIITDDWSGYATLGTRGYLPPPLRNVATCKLPRLSCSSFTSCSPISKHGYAAFTTASARNTCKPTSTNSRSDSTAASTHSTLSAPCLALLATSLRRPMLSFMPKNHCSLLHLVALGANRISTVELLGWHYSNVPASPQMIA